MEKQNYKVVQLDVTLLHEFKDHPFKVIDDEKM